MEPVDRRDFMKTVAGTGALAAWEGPVAVPRRQARYFSPPGPTASPPTNVRQKFSRAVGACWTRWRKGSTCRKAIPTSRASVMEEFPMRREWWSLMRQSWTAAGIAPAPCAAST